MISYRHQVIEQGGKPSYIVHYDGPDHADAMAKWSELIGRGAMYVELESLRNLPRE